MKKIERILKIDLPRGRSAFLWGPRKTGKSTYLTNAFSKSPYFDFLRTDMALEYAKRPALLRERILALDSESLRSPIILDEVQKVPLVLDEVHRMIEVNKLSFLLCGSSARKLKRDRGNLLGGRAWRYEMFPFVSAEIDGLNLIRALNHGLIPDHYLRDDYRKSLAGYVHDYLKEEIFAEGLTRNVPAFAQFFDAAGFSQGELVNYANIARDCGVDAKTVKEYFQILVDMLLGRMVKPFSKKRSRQVITRAPKFYLFDVGVAGFLTKRRIEEEWGDSFGRAFEHFIFTELAAHSSYRELDYRIDFWRTKSGLEVDFVLGEGEVAIEIKGTSRVDQRDLASIRSFSADYRPKKSLVVCNEKEERVVGPLRIMPWRKFLQDLWGGRIIA